MAAKPHEKEPPVHPLADGLRTTSGQDGGTVLDIVGNRIFRLNETGDMILRCLQQGWNETRIAAHIGHQYSVSEGLAKRDVHEFLKVLNDHRMLSAPRKGEER